MRVSIVVSSQWVTEVVFGSTCQLKTGDSIGLVQIKASPQSVEILSSDSAKLQSLAFSFAQQNLPCNV